MWNVSARTTSQRVVHYCTETCEMIILHISAWDCSCIPTKVGLAWTYNKIFELWPVLWVRIDLFSFTSPVRGKTIAHTNWTRVVGVMTSLSASWPTEGKARTNFAHTPSASLDMPLRWLANGYTEERLQHFSLSHYQVRDDMLFADQKGFPYPLEVSSPKMMFVWQSRCLASSKSYFGSMHSPRIWCKLVCSTQV